MKNLVIALSMVLLLSSSAMAQDFEKNAINIVGYQAAQTTTSYVVAPSVGTIFPATAATIEVESSSTDDTGDVTILISGLDTNWNEVSETVTLDGTTAAVTVNSYIRVNKMRMATVGITGVAVGVIKAFLGSEIYCSIAVGQTESQNAFYSVPAGKFAVLKSWSYSALTQPAVFQLKIMSFDGKVTIVDRANITLNANDKTLDYSVAAPPKSDIAVYANSTASTAIVACSFQLNLRQ
jgi:hypothetical protein